MDQPRPADYGQLRGPGRGINVVCMTDAEAQSLFQAMSVLEIREGDRERDNLVTATSRARLACTRHQPGCHGLLILAVPSISPRIF